MITLTKILDPFLPDSNIIETKDYDINKKLYHYISDLPLDDETITFIISVNGNIIDYNKPQDLYIDLKDNSYISICAKVGFDPISATVATIVTGITAGEALLTASALAGMAYYGTYLATYALLAYGVNQLLGALVPDIPSSYQDEQVYSWGDLSQTNLEGITIPYVYGINKMSGNVINQYIDVDQDDNEILYAMMGLCDNEVDSITDIRINDQSSTYYEEVTTASRLGTASDAVIEGFNEVVAQTDVGALLAYSTANTKTTSGVCEKIVVRVSAPNGIFYYDTGGAPSTLFAAYKVGYKDVADSTYTTHSVVVCGPASIILDGISYTRSAYDHDSDENITITSEVLPAVNLNNFLGDTVIASNEFGVKFIFDTSLTEVQRQQFITDNITFFNSTASDDLGETESKSYKTTIDDLTLSQYDVQVMRINNEHSDSKQSSDLYFNNFQERIKQNLTYPGLAKYSVIALATDQLSGGAPTFSCLVEMSTVSVYNQDTLLTESKAATNVAWVVYDLLVNKAGISDDDIIWEEFDAWGTWLDDNSISIKGVVLTDSNYWAEIQRIAVMGRGAIIRRGVKYGVFIDKSDTTISHLFTSSGNIIKDSLTITWIPKTDIANAVEIEYTDPDRDYTRQVMTIISDDYLTTSDISSAKMSIKFDAAVSEDFVKAEGIFRMNCNKWLTKTISFDAYTDSFACTVGDLFYFQHDLPNYSDGFSGRLVGAGNDDGGGSPYITLDKKVSLPTDSTNKILVRLGDGTFVEKTVTVIDADEYSTFNIDSVFTTIPEKYDLYSIGSLESIKKTYRLISVDRRDDFSRTLTGLEYIDEVYTDRSGTIIDVPDWEKVTQEAFNIQLSEVLAFSADGGYKSNLNISWASSLGSNVKYGWDVYIQDATTDTSISQVTANCTKTAYTISDMVFIVGHSYTIYVVPNTQGWNDTGINSASITIEGKLSPPSDVANFNSYWDGINRVVNFTWDHITDIDRDNYEIRSLTSALPGDWGTGVLVKTTIEDSTSIYIENGVSGDQYYAIKAVDNSGIESDNPTVDTLALDMSATDLEIPSGLVLSTGSSIAVDGTDTVYIQAQWDDEVDEDFKEFVVEIEDIDLAFPSESGTVVSEYFWQPVKAATSYGVRIRSIDRGDNTTAYSEQSLITSGSDSTAPATPTNLSITEYFSGLKIEWDHGDEADLSHFIIYRNTTNTPTNAIKVGDGVSDFTSQKSSYTDTPPTLDTYYFWVSAVDYSGNISDKSSGVSGSLNQIGSDDILDGAIDESLLFSDLSDRIDLIDTPITGLVDKVGTNTSLIFTETSQRFSADEALAEDITILYSGIGDNTSAISNEAIARADADSALSSLISTLTSTVDGNTTSVQTNATSIDGIEGKYTVKIDNNGYVSGYGLISTANNGTPTSEFTVLSDKFQVVFPGSAEVTPFIVGLVDGSPQVGVRGALIVDGTIKTYSIAAEAVTTDKLDALAVTADKINVTNLQAVSSSTGDLSIDSGGSIKSGKTSYTDTSNGFWLENDASSGARMYLGGSTKYLKWTGSDLLVGGDIIATGNIQTNAITTVKVLDDAITDMASSNAGSVTCTTTTGNTAISISSFNTNGGNVLLNYTATHASASLDEGSMWVIAYRDTTLLRTVGFSFDRYTYATSLSLIDSGATGTHTYSIIIALQAAHAGKDFYVTGQNLNLTSIKK